MSLLVIYESYWAGLLYLLPIVIIFIINLSKKTSKLINLIDNNILIIVLITLSLIFLYFFASDFIIERINRKGELYRAGESYFTSAFFGLIFGIYPHNGMGQIPNYLYQNNIISFVTSLIIVFLWICFIFGLLQVINLKKLRVLKIYLAIFLFIFFTTGFMVVDSYYFYKNSYINAFLINIIVFLGFNKIIKSYIYLRFQKLVLNLFIALSIGVSCIPVFGHAYLLSGLPVNKYSAPPISAAN